MPMDADLVGKTYPPTAPFAVTAESISAFDAATGGDGAATSAPATYPIVLAFEAMQTFLDTEGLALHHIVHGEQRFIYERPIVAGDTLTATLQVATLRSIGGNDIIGTSSRITDATGALVCTGTATLVHTGGAHERR